MQNFLPHDTGAVEQTAEQGAIRLVAPGAFGRADKIEKFRQRRGGKQIVVDVRNNREPGVP